ncbi:hypothetical protein Fot_35372 [Forsythia ovata]|uniref:Uncharacterized protein n=1 Tax=Forsythia ovata TaxID=205694 RepID=A0ABD1SMS9_9LAMI
MFTCRSLGDKFTNYVKLSDLIELRTVQGSLVRMHSPDKQGSLIRRPSLGKRSSLIRKSSQTFPLVIKRVSGDEEKKAVPEKATEDEDDVEDSKRAKRSQDELDSTILEKLPASFAIVATSVHKHWISAWAKATDNADLLELLKLAEMSTSRSHVLNYELYKVLAMKIDELRSTVVGAEDIDELRSKNKIFHLRLAVFEDAKA